VAGWQFVANAMVVPTLDPSSSTTRMALHPTLPRGIAFSIVSRNMDLSIQTSEVDVCTSLDLGKTTSCVPVGMLDAASPLTIGFGYSPGDEKTLVVALKGTTNAHLFRSTNGGLSFVEEKSFQGFSSSPWGVTWTAGATPALAVRTTDKVFVSGDAGLTYPVLYDQADCFVPSWVGQLRGNFALDAADPTTRLLACDVGGARRCQGGTCAASVLPAGDKIDAVALSPSDPTSAVALASDTPDTLRLLTSTDGGLSFTAASAPALAGAGSGYLAHDPRPASPHVYAGFFTPSGAMQLLRSSDKGHSWQDITPPPETAPSGSFFPVEFAVAADGALIARAGDNGIARLPPPACTAPSDCVDPTLPFCDAVSGACVACLGNTDCVSGPSCDPQTKTCGDCVDDAGCVGRPEGASCQMGLCRCGSDADCTGSALGSHCSSLPINVCGCATSADCQGTGHTLCIPETHLCTDPCTKNADCFQAPGVAGPICDAQGSKLCVACVSDSDCAGNLGGSTCLSGKNTCGCGKTADCPAGVCDAVRSLCVGCLSNGDCAGNPQSKVCNQAESACAACVTSADCKAPGKPFCIVPQDYPLTAYCWDKATP
jgi:hypothetical protein